MIAGDWYALAIETLQFRSPANRESQLCRDETRLHSSRYHMVLVMVLTDIDTVLPN